MNRLIRAELLKYFTTRMWWGLLIGVVAASAALSGLVAAAFPRHTGATNGPGLDDPAMIRFIYSYGMGVTRLIALAFGIIVIAGEIRHQTMTSTALAAPRRWRIVASKLAAVMLIGVGYGVIGVASAVAAGAPVIALRGAATRLLSDGVPRSLLMQVIAVSLWAVIGLGLGTLIRNQVVALLVSIGVAWIIEPIAVTILDAVHVGSVARFFPSAATSALVSPPTDLGGGGLHSTLLPWWGAALVLIGYAVVSGGLGASITLRRDIT